MLFYFFNSGNVGCPNLNINNGAVTYTDQINTGSVALITCNDGFLLRGPNNRECQNSGEWTGEESLCLSETSGKKTINSFSNGTVIF